MRSAANVIIPAQARMPAPSAVGAVQDIVRIAGSDPVLDALLIDGLQAIEANAMSAHGTRFDLLAADQQTAIVAGFETANMPAGCFPALRDLVDEADHTQARVMKLLGYNFRVLVAGAPHQSNRSTTSGSQRVRSMAPLLPAGDVLSPQVRQDRVDVVVIGSGGRGGVDVAAGGTRRVGTLPRTGRLASPGRFRIRTARLRGGAAARPRHDDAERLERPEDYPVNDGRRRPEQHRDVERRRRRHRPPGSGLPRFHPSDFAVRDLDGAAAGLADFAYSDLEPFYDQNDPMIGVCGLAPATRPTRRGPSGRPRRCRRDAHAWRWPWFREARLALVAVRSAISRATTTGDWLRLPW